MRYTAEFKISPQDMARMDDNPEGVIEYLKRKQACELGNAIAENIGFEEIPDEGKYFRLEVQVFSMKDWKKFKEEIREHIINSFTIDRAQHELVKFKEMLGKLESKGLPEPENKAQ